MLRDEVNRHQVVPALPWDNDVRVAAAGRHEMVKCGFDEADVLLDDPLGVPPALLDVALDAARQAHVVVWWCVG
jgi:hypothetical protein